MSADRALARWKHDGVRVVPGDGEAVAVNLDIEPVDPPEGVAGVDPSHPESHSR